KLFSSFEEHLPLLLRLFDAICILNPPVMLPTIKQKTESEESGDQRNQDVFATAADIGLANDGCIVDPFVEVDFDSRHYFFSHARNFALRARGLRRTSSSTAVTTFLVNTVPGTEGVRNLFFTIRSSSE